MVSFIALSLLIISIVHKTNESTKLAYIILKLKHSCSGVYTVVNVNFNSRDCENLFPQNVYCFWLDCRASYSWMSLDNLCSCLAGVSQNMLSRSFFYYNVQPRLGSFTGTQHVIPSKTKPLRLTLGVNIPLLYTNSPHLFYTYRMEWLCPIIFLA